MDEPNVTANDAPEQSTAERAFAEFTAPEDKTVDAGQAAATGQADPNAAADPNAQQQPDPAQPQLTDEQLQADPRYKELAEFRDELSPILAEHKIPNAGELKLQLSDAAILYEIANGKAEPTKLLDTMVNAGFWGQERVDKVAQGLITWLQSKGYLQGGAAPQGGQGGAQPNAPDPMTQRLDKIESDIKARADAEKARETAAYQEKVFNSFRGEVAKFCEEKGIPPEDVDLYGQQARRMMGDKFDTIIKQIEKGNFVEVRKLLDQFHTAELKRLQRYTTRIAQDKERQDKTTPKSPTGGIPPSSAAQPKRNFANRDERLAAATEAMKS